MMGKGAAADEPDLWARAIEQVGPPPPPIWTAPASTRTIPPLDPPPEGPPFRQPAAVDPRSRPRFGRPHLPVRARSWRPGAGNNVTWLLVGLSTLGLLFPIPAVINGVRALRSGRREDLHGRGSSPARTSGIWALVFTVGSLVAYPLVFTAGGSSPAAGRPRVPAPRTIVVGPGATVSVLAQVAAGTTHDVPLSIRLSDTVFPTTTSAIDVNATVRIQVCAGPLSIDPLLAVVGVAMIDDRGRSHHSADGSPLPAAFFAGTLGPHACLVGTVGYRLPSGTTPERLTFVGDNENINWSAN